MSRRFLPFVSAALLLFSACNRTASTTTLDSGVEGAVLAGPTCPVETADSPCPDRPVAADVTVVRASSGAFVKKGKSAEDGSFRIPLPPGRYIVSAQSSAASLGGNQPVTVTVVEGQFTSIEIHLDTGIR